MPGRRFCFGRAHHVVWALVTMLVCLTAWPSAGQSPARSSGLPGSSGPALGPATNVPGADLSSLTPPGTLPQIPDETVVDVRVVGNQAIPLTKIVPHIRTRPGRPFDMEVVEGDVRRLTQSRMFVNVKTYSKRVEGGRVVVFEVLERPTIHYVRYKGNSAIKLKTLKKESGLKAGDAFDTYSVEEARRRLEDYYHEKGYSRARVTLVEGGKPTDQGVEFLINEGQKQRVLWTDFVGNTIASDDRLRTQIQSKPGFLWLFKGEVDRKKIDEDIDKLTAYYRGLGFFRARVGRELRFNEAQNWLTLTFVIDEGPRYKVRGVSIAGNTKFSNDELAEKLKLKSGEFFNQAMMTKDVATIQETYGGIGYVFADVKADPRFLEEPGELDLVYKINEGDRCRVGRINVNIEGDASRTQITTILNRLSLRPGDIVDIREVRASERRLLASGLFLSDPAAGAKPKIAFSPPEMDKEEGGQKKSEVAREPDRPRGFRGQSPTESPADYWSQQAVGFRDEERVLDLTIEGRLVPQPGQAVPMPAPTEILPNESGEPSSAPARAGSRPTIIRGQYTPDSGYSIPNTRPWSGTRSSTTGGTVWDSYTPPSSSTTNPWAPAPSSGSGTAAGGSTTGPIVQPSTNPPGVQANAPQPAATPAAPQPGAAAPAMGAAPVPGWQPAGSPATAQPAAGAAAPGTTSTTAGVSRGVGANDVGIGTTAPATNATAPTPMTPVTAMPAASYGSYRGPTTSTTAQSQSTMQPVAQSGPQFAAPANNPPAYAPPPSSSSGPPSSLVPGSPPLFSNSSVFAATAGESDFSRPIPLDVIARETETGRLMVGVGVNSEAGLLGSVVIDERNFDWTRFPRSWEDVRSGRAWRGAGQGFRIEAVPGTELQRYMINFREPYLFNSEIGLSLSGFYYDRQYQDWDENRTGGRAGLSYQFNHDLSGIFTFRGERVTLSDPATPTPQVLQDALGHNALYGFEFKLVHDTRDSSFLPTEGHLIELGMEQVIGTYQYPRASVDLRRHFTLTQRPDGSGRHVLSMLGRFGWTGDDTPIYDHYFAGGYSTLRGFDFRGASPSEMGVFVGGEAMVLTSVEYMFPITADDMLRAVVFCDVGTVEPRLDTWNNRWRVAPGFGLRITIPFMGPAPIALDLAFPVSHEPGDDINNFSFFIGFGR